MYLHFVNSLNCLGKEHHNILIGGGGGLLIPKYLNLIKSDQSHSLLQLKSDELFDL